MPHRIPYRRASHTCSGLTADKHQHGPSPRQKASYKYYTTTIPAHHICAHDSNMPAWSYNVCRYVLATLECWIQTGCVQRRIGQSRLLQDHLMAIHRWEAVTKKEIDEKIRNLEEKVTQSKRRAVTVMLQ